MEIAEANCNNNKINAIHFVFREIAIEKKQ